MEIKRRFIIGNSLKAAGYEIVPVAELYTSWSIGRGGVYTFFEKRPVLVLLKQPAVETTVHDIDGKVLTIKQAIEMVPELKEILEP